MIQTIDKPVIPIEIDENFLQEQIERYRTTEIGSGCFRAVLKHKTDHRLVIKFAMNYGGIKENEKEIKFGLDHPLYAPTLEDYCPNFTWLIQERVIPLHEYLSSIGVMYSQFKKHDLSDIVALAQEYNIQTRGIEDIRMWDSKVWNMGIRIQTNQLVFMDAGSYERF